MALGRRTLTASAPRLLALGRRTITAAPAFLTQVRHTLTTAAPRCMAFGLRSFSVISLGLLVVQTVTACGDEDSGSDPSCYLGQTRACVGDQGCQGTETCGAGEWKACLCRADPNKSSDPPAAIGHSCSSDSECLGGTTCLTPNSTAWFGGGPPVGVCVADCTGDASLCNNFTAAICVDVDPAHSLCMPSCNSTASAGTAPCSTMPHSVCDLDSGQTTGYCRPLCVLDSDCGSGICDRRNGSCAAAQPEGLTIGFGQSCNPDLANCDGVCLQLSPGNHVCTSRCSFGNTSECADSASATRVGACAYAGTSVAQKGSLGYCAPLCDCNDDCVASGFVCEPFSNQATTAALGRRGLCFPVIDSAGASHVGQACQ